MFNFEPFKEFLMKKLLIALLLAMLLSPLSLAQGKYGVFLKYVDSAPFILVNKQLLTLALVDKEGEPVVEYGIACAHNYGNKHKRGDHRTPEGIFPINEFLYAARIPHDFHDGKGPVKGAYGPWFLRLDVPGIRDIGIHGTHLPESIGSRATEGCIRLRNENILDLKSRVKLGTPVIITPDPLLDASWNDAEIIRAFAPEKGADIFISYSPRDISAAESLCRKLDSTGITYYMDRDGLDGGMDHPKVLAANILQCKVFLCICGENSAQDVFQQSAIAYAEAKKPADQIVRYEKEGDLSEDALIRSLIINNYVTAL